MSERKDIVNVAHALFFASFGVRAKETEEALRPMLAYWCGHVPPDYHGISVSPEMRGQISVDQCVSSVGSTPERALEYWCIVNRAVVHLAELLLVYANELERLRAGGLVIPEEEKP